jgi:hypothetical protein
MKRNDVIVDGVKLTREQVERAMKELDAPPVPEPGEVWTRERGHIAFVVLNQDDAWLEADKRASGDYLPQGAVRHVMDNGEIYYARHDDLKRIGYLKDIVAFYREQKGL